jgi:hypothetical protein
MTVSGEKQMAANKKKLARNRGSAATAPALVREALVVRLAPPCWRQPSCRRLVVPWEARVPSMVARGRDVFP